MDNGAVVQQAAGVVEFAVDFVGVAEEDFEVAAMGGDALYRLAHLPVKAGAQQQVFGRVAADGHFREDDQVRLSGAGGVDPRHDPLGVSGDVAHADIDLRDGDAF